MFFSRNGRELSRAGTGLISVQSSTGFPKIFANLIRYYNTEIQLIIQLLEGFNLKLNGLLKLSSNKTDLYRRRLQFFFFSLSIDILDNSQLLPLQSRVESIECNGFLSWKIDKATCNYCGRFYDETRNCIFPIMKLKHSSFCSVLLFQTMVNCFRCTCT